MVQEIHIKNYKSIVDLKLDLGQVNLFIGENGCGKTNILEAIGLGGSAKTDGVNNALLLSKGIRLSRPELMSSAFSNDIPDIEIDFLVDKYSLNYKLKYSEDKGGKWINSYETDMLGKFAKFLISVSELTTNKDFFKVEATQNDRVKFNIDYDLVKDSPKKVVNRLKREGEDFETYFNNINDNSQILDFIIYSPELSSLRKFEEEGQVTPLGCRGEGLFSLIKNSFEDEVTRNEIKSVFELIDWYEDFFIPNDLITNEYKINIKDRFIDSNLKFLDQRSANEGFLFLLFYSTLFTSDKTPSFFAIDNIDISFNPKLCSEIIRVLVEMSKKHTKQVLLTTHNPATLDGIDLKDESQRLFVVRRNIHGHTIANRVTGKPKTTKPMKLSEAWMQGLLGGLPNNF